MNIFAVDLDPKIAARSLIDRHIIKMPSESCIMLANAYSTEQLRQAPRTKTQSLRGHSYPHHGCTKWVIYSMENFRWMVDHSIELCNEYTFRFGKVHFCAQFIEWCNNVNPSLSYKGLTSHFLAMPATYKSHDVELSYRAYYLNDKRFTKSGKDMWVWTKRNKPLWA